MTQIESIETLFASPANHGSRAYHVPIAMRNKVLEAYKLAGSLRSWVHYCQLRMDKATQKEHRGVAEQCWAIIGQYFPDVIKALGDIKVCDDFESKLP